MYLACVCITCIKKACAYKQASVTLDYAFLTLIEGHLVCLDKILINNLGRKRDKSVSCRSGAFEQIITVKYYLYNHQKFHTYAIL